MVVFLILADYCAEQMVGQYLIPGTMELTDIIVECGIFTASGWIC